MIGLPRQAEQKKKNFFRSVTLDVPLSSMILYWIQTNWLQIFWPPGIFMKKMVMLSTITFMDDRNFNYLRKALFS